MGHGLCFPSELTHPFEAQIHIHSVKPNKLTHVLQDMTGTMASSHAPYELGPGIIYVIELPSRTLRCITHVDNIFPKSFYSMADEANVWDEMIVEEDRDSYASSWSNDLDNTEVRYQALTSRRGAKVPICEYRMPLHNAAGRLVGAICRITDDSFRTMAMDALVRRSWKELATTMTRRLLHDFNNTIAGIYSLSELYAEPGSDAQSMTEAMGHIRDSSIRSQEITKKIRQLTTLENGTPSYFSLEKLVKNQHEYLQALLPNGAKISYEVANSEITVFLDANQFRQAILHIAGNASNAATDDVEILIRVSTYQESDQPVMARIDFCDNGAGIDEANTDKSFTPFFTTKDPKRHPGLGLNIVKSFIEKSGGSIEIQSKGAGTTVSLCLPIAELKTNKPQYPQLISEPPSKQSVSPPKESEPKPLELVAYTWEDIARHPLLLAMRSTGWDFRVHLEPGQLLIDLAQPDRKLDGVLIFKSALDEKVEPLLSELGFAKNCPKVAIIALGESIEGISEAIRNQCGLVAAGSTKPTVLLNKLAKFYR